MIPFLSAKQNSMVGKENGGQDNAVDQQSAIGDGDPQQTFRFLPVLMSFDVEAELVRAYRTVVVFGRGTHHR